MFLRRSKKKLSSSDAGGGRQDDRLRIGVLQFKEWFAVFLACRFAGRKQSLDYEVLSLYVTIEFNKVRLA